MGGALLTRWGDACINEKEYSRNLPNFFSVIDRSPNADIGSRALSPPRFQAYASLQKFADNLSQQKLPAPDALLLAVRPKQVLPTLNDARHLLAPSASVVSLAAGLPLTRMRSALRANKNLSTPLFRVMPSIPVAIGEGIVLIASDSKREQELSYVRSLFAPMGRCVFCSDELLDKGTGLWGSAPGYLFQMIHAFEATACELGYKPDQARLLAFQTLKGVGLFAEKQHAEKNISPQELVASIALPGGTTEAGLRILNDKKTGLVPLMQKAGQLAYQRAQNMAQEIAAEEEK